MSNNGSNDWGVEWCNIQFLERILNSHDNIIIESRHDDIIFEVVRRRQGDNLRIVCINKYSVSVSDVMRAMDEFGPINVIYYGGKWNGHTSEAEALCNENRIGIYNAGGLAPALRRDRYWNEPRGNNPNGREQSDESAAS